MRTPVKHMNFHFVDLIYILITYHQQVRVERIKASWHGGEADATISADNLSAVFCSVTPEQVNHLKITITGQYHSLQY